MAAAVEDGCGGGWLLLLLTPCPCLPLLDAHSWCVGDYCVIDETGAKPTPPSKKRKSKGSLGESFAVIRSSPKVHECVQGAAVRV